VDGCSIDGCWLKVCASTAFVDKSGILQSVESELGMVGAGNIYDYDFADVVGD